MACAVPDARAAGEIEGAGDGGIGGAGEGGGGDVTAVLTAVAGAGGGEEEGCRRGLGWMVCRKQERASRAAEVATRGWRMDLLNGWGLGAGVQGYGSSKQLQLPGENGARRETWLHGADRIRGNLWSSRMSDWATRLCGQEGLGCGFWHPMKDG